MKWPLIALSVLGVNWLIWHVFRTGIFDKDPEDRFYWAIFDWPMALLPYETRQIVRAIGAIVVIDALLGIIIYFELPVAWQNYIEGLL